MEPRKCPAKAPKQKQWIKRTNPLSLIAKVYHQARPPYFMLQLKAN